MFMIIYNANVVNIVYFIYLNKYKYKYLKNFKDYKRILQIFKSLTYTSTFNIFKNIFKLISVGSFIWNKHKCLTFDVYD